MSEQPGPGRDVPEISRSKFLNLNGAVMVAGTLMAVAILHLGSQGWDGALAAGHHWAVQAAVGLAIGVAAGLLMLKIDIQISYFREVEETLKRVIRESGLTRFELLFVAASAGWWEELLFRGALQPLFGVWFAAAAFALAHGIASLRNWGGWVYTALLFAFGLGLGWLFEWSGLVAVMVAHAAYDAVLLLYLHRVVAREGHTAV